MTIQLLVFCFVQKLTTLLPNILCFMKVNSFLLLNICLLCLQKRSFVVRQKNKNISFQLSMARKKETSKILYCKRVYMPPFHRGIQTLVVSREVQCIPNLLMISNPSFACKPHTPWARSFWAFSPFQPYSQNTFNLYRSKQFIISRAVRIGKPR